MTNDERDGMLVRTEALLGYLSDRVTALVVRVEAMATELAERRGRDSSHSSAWGVTWQVLGLLVAIGAVVIAVVK